jgi:hypothetical protein
MRLIDIEPDVSSLFQVELSKPTKQLDVVFDYSTGHIIGYVQVDVDAASTSTTSASIMREPAAASDFIRGNSESSPFMPGGYDSTEAPRTSKASSLPELDSNDPTIPGLGFGLMWDKDGISHVVSEKEASILSRKGTSTFSRLNLFVLLESALILSCYSTI